MLDPSTDSYVGMVTGVIGAVTGVAGGILGYIGYRKTNEIKSLDLRIELKKELLNFPIFYQRRKSYCRVQRCLVSVWLQLWVDWRVEPWLSGDRIMKVI